MGSLYKDLHNLYQVSKTLRFELQPQGKTLDYMEKDGIFSKDEKRAELFKKVKGYCDEYHKQFIESCLEKFSFKDLNQYYLYFTNANKSETDIKIFEQIQGNLRKEVASAFKNAPEFKGLQGKELVENYLVDFYKDKEAELNDIEFFKGFTTYFTGYYKNRENMYSDEEKSTSIAYRIVNQNLPVFLKNIKCFSSVREKLGSDLSVLQNELSPYINSKTLEAVFSLNYFNSVLTQKGIESYNLLISGVSEENNIKIKGLNEYINLYNQKNKEKLPKLQELYKQILSDKNSSSFKFDIINNDEELKELVSSYCNLLIEKVVDDKSLSETLLNIGNYDLNRISVRNTSITAISKAIFGDYSFINRCFENFYDSTYSGKLKKGSEKYAETRKKDIDKQSTISIQFIENCIDLYSGENKGKLVDYFKNFIFENSINEKIKANYEQCIDILNNENNAVILGNSDNIEKIKNLLDSIKSLQEFIKTLILSDNTVETDREFYGILNEKYSFLEEVIPVYNKTRNYATKKPYSTEKIKLNFNCTELCGGWDINKEQACLGTLFMKGGNYYLGILNTKYKKVFKEYNEAEYQADTPSGNYQKIEYKLLPGPHKMLPKVFFSEKGKSYYCPDDELLRKYHLDCYKKGDKFDIDFCHELIDFYKKSINKNEDWKIFNFEFTDTKNYMDISQFYKEVEQQGYCIKYRNISSKYIDSLVDEGKLYFFKLYNKDFSEYSKGRENLHTMYWKALFDEDNLKNVVYKLNGEAEIFYRKKSLEPKITHPKNQPIDNKNPDTIIKKKTSTFTYDLIKDRRYTADKLQFHVPITMNFKSQGQSNINERVNNNICSCDDLYIVGIDRGERHLLYVSVINSSGRIVEQYSLNEIVNEYNGNIYKTNYHSLLDKKEKERDKARKSWNTIENIKELKEGYMSQVINKIVQLMQKYNAIVVLEDLEFGFKNSRIKVEKQVYQKFEQMLINKLNYLVIKGKQKYSDGGVLNAYQLTNKFESFNELDKQTQTGILFYISAWCTSKIDPVTGFVNLFNTKYENIDKSKQFISKFKDIRYNSNEDYFEFVVDDYAKFTDKLKGSRKDWILCSFGDRISTYRNPEQNNNWDNKKVILTEEFKSLFAKYGININNIQKEIDTKNNLDKEFYTRFFALFKLMVQMRNSVSGEFEDYIISPVKGKNGSFYDSRICGSDLPKDADANGAYNIARKGLMLVNRLKAAENKKKVSYKISNQEWLNFVQNMNI